MDDLNDLWDQVRRTHRLPFVHVDYLLESDRDALPIVEYSINYVVESSLGTLLEHGVVEGGMPHPEKPPSFGTVAERLDLLLGRLYAEGWRVAPKDGDLVITRVGDDFTDHAERYHEQYSKLPSYQVDNVLDEYAPPRTYLFLDLQGVWEGQEAVFSMWLSGMHSKLSSVLNEPWAVISEESQSKEAFLGERITDDFEEDAVHQRSPGRFPRSEHSHPDIIEDREEDGDTSEGVIV